VENAEDLRRVEATVDTVLRVDENCATGPPYSFSSIAENFSTGWSIIADRDDGDGCKNFRQSKLGPSSLHDDIPERPQWLCVAGSLSSGRLKFLLK
jgi:hypothetical protein